MRICYNCGARLQERERVPFKELCPKCDAFLHCCRNCRLYAPDAPNHCRSSTTEHVPDVERGNYCDEFEFRYTEVEPRPRRSPDDKPADEGPRPGGMSAREKFENLFND